MKWQVNYHYLYHNKKKTQKIPRSLNSSNRKMVQRCKIETPNTQIHACLLQGLQYKVVVLMKLFYGHPHPPQ
jgi:hypothetical protein